MTPTEFSNFYEESCFHTDTVIIAHNFWYDKMGYEVALEKSYFEVSACLQSSFPKKGIGRIGPIVNLVEGRWCVGELSGLFC